VPRVRRAPRIVAGEPELHRWCPVCQLPSRVSVPLHLDHLGAPPAGVLEICPGCGTGHDRPSIATAIADQPGPHRRLLPAVAHAIHARLCRRRGQRAVGCAHRDCPWPGLYRNQRQMVGEDGTWRFLFCTRRHLRAWARDYQFTL
jgi:hypothetical protein